MSLECSDVEGTDITQHNANNLWIMKEGMKIELDQSGYTKCVLHIAGTIGGN